MRCVSVPECSRYVMDETGVVTNVETGYILHPYKGMREYLYYKLRADDPSYTDEGYKHIYIHTYLARLFIPNPNSYRYVIHLNGDCLDNELKNLCWSPIPNKSYHLAIKLYKTNGGI